MSITMSEITSFLQKSFQSFSSSIILPLGVIAYELAKCAKSHTYVETLGKHADTLHDWIKKSYVEDYEAAFECAVRKAVKNLRMNYAKLAIDITSEPFYGSTTSIFLFNVDDKKWNAEFHFIVVSVITRKKQIPLMALPVIVGEGVAKPTIDLLEYAQTLFKKILFATFDRGFYCAELIDYLEARKIRYLMLVPEKKGSIKNYVEQTFELGKFKHEMCYAKEKSKWRPKTTIVVCKGIDEFAWIFATNINFRTRCEYILHYKRRWQIETNFRVEDEARIKSKSCNHLIRYFYFLVSLLFHLLWIVNKNIRYHVQFKRYLDVVEQELFFEFLGVQPNSV
jgi:hypothetical protein